jgi:hypothetical protein
MKTLAEFTEGIIKDGYKFIRKAKKPFGYRVIGHKGGWTEKRILIYVHTKKTPTPSDFDKFLVDFEKFHKTNEEKYNVEAGYLLLGSCPKRLLQAFKTSILKHASPDLRKKVKIVQLKI